MFLDYGSTSQHHELLLPKDGHNMGTDQSNLDNDLYNLSMKHARMGHKAPQKVEDLSVVKELRSDVAFMGSYSPEECKYS
jgi:hypothetical protein